MAGDGSGAMQAFGVAKRTASLGGQWGCTVPVDYLNSNVLHPNARMQIACAEPCTPSDSAMEHLVVYVPNLT